MNKAFTKETDDAYDAADDANISNPILPANVKNYISAAGYARLCQECLQLIDEERPKVVEAVHWAAKNGDRSENGDYLYGKKRLREIDKRIHFLNKRLKTAQVVDASVHFGCEQVFFGAHVTYAYPDGREQNVTILGVDEAQSTLQQVSWVSPIAQTLLKAHVGDSLRFPTPTGVETIEVVAVQYPEPEST